MDAVGVGPGDRVLCATLTFAATANAVRYVGAEPVFIDCEETSWNLDPALLERELERARAAGETPKALIAVDLYGQTADYDRIEPLCREHGVVLVEDAAEALGARHGKRPMGNDRLGAMSSRNCVGGRSIFGNSPRMSP